MKQKRKRSQVSLAAGVKPPVTDDQWEEKRSSWDWIPDIRDASIPFVFGALELFVNHTITQSMSLWFIGLAGISALGAIGTVHMVWRAREESESAT